MNNFDVVVIGSGLGGLCCGLILSKEGKKVCVVEKEPFVGGCLRSFRRGDYFFDTGMHYIGSMDDGEMMNHFLRYAGVYDRLKLRRMDEVFDRTFVQGEEYHFSQGYPQFEASFAERFPESRPAIHEYAQSLRTVGEKIGVEKLREGILSTSELADLSVSASQEIDRIISNPRLREVVASINFLYDGIRDHSPFYTHAMIQHSFIKGAYRFVGGSQQLADVLKEEIQRMGGEVRCRSEVVEILHKDNEVRGVKLGNGEQLTTCEVVSDIHPVQLLKMVSEDCRIRPMYRRRIQSLSNSFGIFSVYAKVDKRLFPYRNCNYYIADKRGVWQDPEKNYFPHTIMMSMQASDEEHPLEVVSLLMLCPYAMFSKWADSKVGHRGEEYKTFKAKISEEMISEVGAYVDGLKSAIREVYTASPLTYRDYTGVVDGSAYGIMNDSERPLESMLRPTTKLKGLYLTGESVNNHGALGVLMTSIATCGEMLGVDYICRKIANR